MPILEARGLSVQEAHAQPLPGPVDLALEAGEILALGGPSGAGKTTLLRALALLDPRATGEVRFEGRPVADAAVPAFRRRVVYLAQKTPAGPEPVEAALKAPFAFRTAAGRVFDRGRAARLLDRLGLPDMFLERRMDALSVGEAQRVGLVRALLVDPTVLLLDEPTSALDPDGRLAAEALVTEWHRDGGRAAVLVSHDAEQVERLATRRLALAHGRLAREPAP